MQVESWSATRHDVVKIVLDEIPEILRGQPDIDKNSAKALLINLPPSAPQIKVFAYYRTPGADWAAFLVQQESILLKMMDAIETAGSQPRLPRRRNPNGDVKQPNPPSTPR